MASPQFNVVVDGTVLDGFESGAVLLQLQQQLKLPAAKAQQLLAGNAVTVKRAVDEAVANGYCKRLLALGVHARIEAVASPTGNPIAAAKTERSAPAPIRYRTRHFFSDAPLAADDTTNSPAFRRALLRAGVACIGTVLAYAALVFVSVGSLLFYTVHYAYLLLTPPVLFSATVYLIVTVVLALLAALLVRPLLPRQPASDTAALLSPIQDPALFAFIAQLCAKLALRQPEKIIAQTATTNTAAILPGFRNLQRGDYRLTLSLPALENSTINQFAGMLAADLATQASMPMLRYRRLANLVGAQLDNCLANRDWIALHLAARTQITPSKFTAALHIGEKLIEQTNRFFAKIVARLQRIEATLLRPLLLEQDRYSALIAGSDQYTELMIFRVQLETAAHDANAKNVEDRIEGGLVDDLPALIKHYYEGVDENFARTIRRQWDADTTPRRNEPPVVRERIEQVKNTAAPGIIDDNQPALTLLQQRDALARQITLDTYREAKLCFDPDRLLPVDELTYAATQDMLQRQQAAVYFNDWFRPFRFWSLAEYSLIREMPPQDAAAQLSVCVNEIRRLSPDRTKLLAAYERLQNQLCEILLAQHVLAAGKPFAFRYNSYDGTTLAPVLEDRQQQLGAIMEKLAQQEAVMGGRITLGLRLSGQAERELQELHDALRLLHDIGARLYKLSLDCFQLEQLLQRQHQLREADYSLPIKKLETKINDTSTLLIVRLNDIPYPLDHRHRSLKSFVETILDQSTTKQRSPILQRTQRLLDALYRVNEKLSRQAADYGTIAEEAYRIEPIKLISNE